MVLQNRLRIGVDARNLTSSMVGIARYVHELSRELIEAGHELVLYLPEDPSGPLPELSRARSRIARMSGPALRQVWAHTILPTDIRRDALDVFWGPAHRLPPFLPETLARVITIHDLVWVHAPETMRTRTRIAEQAFMKRSVGRADIVVADSHATARDLAQTFPGLGKQIVTVYAGITKVAGSNATALPSAFGIDKPYVLFVGTLEPRKNLKRLLDAWRMLSSELRDARYLVISGGKGWGMDSLSAEVETRGLGASVLQTGFVSDEQLTALYANAELLVMPSLYEGFGLPIVEANAHGVPALTSNLSCMPEIAGAKAIFVDPYSASSIAEGLRSVLSGERDRSTLTEAALANASRFSWCIAARELTDVFERAMAMRKNL